MDRALLLGAFGFEYVGNDDLIFWQGATDYANGIFHEPYFYAQNYNFMFEALLAVPFLWLGVPCHVALPLCTSLATLFPYFLFSAILYKRGHTIGAYAFLLMPLFLPVEYGMLTTMSRGFVAGLFFSGFLVFPLVRPDRLSSFAILALAGSFGYIANPNASIFVLPVGIWVWMENIRRISFYLTTLVGVIPALAVQWLAGEFYVSYPDHNVHSMWSLQFDLGVMLAGFTRLDRFFSYLSPVTWSFGWAFLLSLVFIAIKLRRRSWRRSVALYSGLLFMFLLMGVNKVNDDIGNLFLCSVRMYLAAPLVLALAIWWLFDGQTGSRTRNMAVLSLAVCMLLIKMPLHGSVARDRVAAIREGPIDVWSMKELRSECDRLAELINKHHIDLLVLVPYWEPNQGVPAMGFRNYACPLLEEQFAHTLMNVYERRTWVFNEEQRNVHPNILIVGRPTDIEPLRAVPGLSIEKLDPSMILLLGNKETTGSVLNSLKIELKRHTY